MNLELLKLEILQSLNPLFPKLGINLLKKKICPCFQSTLRFLLLFAVSTAFTLVQAFCHWSFGLLPLLYFSYSALQLFSVSIQNDTKLNHVSPAKRIPILWINPCLYCGLQAFIDLVFSLWLWPHFFVIVYIYIYIYNFFIYVYRTCNKFRILYPCVLKSRK